MTSLHKAVISDPKKLAHEIASDVMASEDEIAEAIALALRSSRNEVIEMCAAKAEAFPYVVASKTKTTVNSSGKTVPIMTLLNEPEIVRGIASSIRSLKDHSNG